MRLAFVLLFATALAAAEPERGKLIENIPTRSDATQTYTLYLPASYDAAKRQPLLLVFDPRGRGTAAAEIFREGAEEYGWILISSNQTRSDDDGVASTRAVQALLPEVSRYASDARRIYATGFSGTAILSCAVGLNTNALAGVISVGGRLVLQVPPAMFSFAHYGFAGDTDFNNREMRLIDALLEREGKAHRFQQFSGEHSWISAELAREAMAWMELIAMKEKRRARDETLIAKLYDVDMAAARALDTGGRRVEALRRYRDVVNTFGGLHATDDATAAVTRLQAMPAVQRQLKEIARWDEYEMHYTTDVFAHVSTTFARLKQEERPPTASVLAREFRLAELQRHARQDGFEGLAGRRLLATLYGQTNFYLREQLTQKGDYVLAAAVAGVATQIHPDRWRSWYNLGAMQARAGDRGHALESLEKAFAAGFDDPSWLAVDEDFVSLRGEPRFERLLAPASQ